MAPIRTALACFVAATLALTGLVLGRHAAQEDVAIGCPFANRPTGDTQKLIGFFVNTLPVRVRWNQVDSFRALLRRPDHVPLDLVLAELRGCVAGPRAYLTSRRALAQRVREGG